MEDIRILIVEDDPMVLDIHKKFISTIEGFKVIDTAPNGDIAIKILKKKDIDLIILDIYMPEIDGIEMLKRVRRAGKDIDIIMITAAQEGNIIKEVVRYGAFDYIIKPFKYERFKNALVAYQRHFETINRMKEEFSQRDVDNMFKQKREEPKQWLPKGIQYKTLKSVINALNSNGNGLSAEEIARIVSISRVTARRYLEYLVSIGKAHVEPSYRDIGRPINKYNLFNTQ